MSGAGLLILGLGVAAVFTSKNQAGTVALIAVGAFFLTVGLLRKLPIEATVGNVSFEFAAVALENLLEDEDFTVKAAAVDAVQRISEKAGNLSSFSAASLPESLGRAQSSISSQSAVYESRVIDALRSLVSEDVQRDPRLATNEGEMFHYTFDAIIGKIHKPESAIAVEARLTIRADSMLPVIARVAAAGIGRLLVVAPIAPEMRIGAARFHAHKLGVKFEAVSWENEADNSALSKAIEILSQ